MSRVITKTMIVLTLIVTLAPTINAQKSLETKSSRRWGVPDKPTNAETNAIYMEQVRELMREEPNPSGVMIIIGRLGTGEISHELNRRRLFNVGERYRVSLGIPAEKVVVAEGERINGFGRVEIYWNGELIVGLPVSKNKDIYVDCCGPDERYYPYKEAIDRTKKNKRSRQRRG